MPRIRRGDLLYDGCYAHIISRSIRKLSLFKDQEDFKYFYELLSKVKNKFHFKIFHYCIMHTHFHLVVSINDVQEFPKAMAGVKRDYCYQYHSKYRLSGPIWRERYRALLIEDEDYLYACGRYVENNPVDAGIVESPEDWQYSSAKHYESNQKDKLIDDYVSTKMLNAFRDEPEYGKEFFEEARVIGSDFFKYKMMKTLKGSDLAPS